MSSFPLQPQPVEIALAEIVATFPNFPVLERFSAIYTPAAVAIATLVAVVPPLFLGADWIICVPGAPQFEWSWEATH
jgi:hypothetical protein